MSNGGVNIMRRKLREEEIELLSQDIKTFPDLVYIGKDRWRKYQFPYVLEDNGIFKGVCAIYEFNEWIKVGPFVILKVAHGKGYGKRLFDKILNDYSTKEIFLASSNPAVRSILSKNGFNQTKDFCKLPNKMKLFLIEQIFIHLSFGMAKEFIRKLIVLKRGGIYFFTKSK